MNFQLRWILLLGVVGFCVSILHSAGEKSLWSIQQTLSSKRYVDLTHAFEPGIPRWPGFPDEMRKTIYWYEKTPRHGGRRLLFGGFHARWTMGHACRSACAFHQGAADRGSNRSQGTDSPARRCRCS